MDDYTLLYWSVPFRGQFVRAVLAFAGKSWTETGDDEIAQIMEAPVKDMPVPFMGPPVLVDNGNGFAVSQMPAIILYLGESLGLLPDDAGLKALTIKVVNDANDVIDEITLNGGRDMWNEKRWAESRPRFAKWMTMWEVLGEQHGLEADKGFLLGGAKPGIADVITATLWTTMADRFSQIEALLAETAPKTHALARRISALPALVALNETARQDYGDNYAGGEIGKSMAKVLDA
jgi:glutathione S-transferase